MGNVFDKTYGFISDVIHVNWLKTLYINFRMLPFIDAIRLPIIIWGRCQLKIFIEPNANLCMGELSSLGSCSSLVCSKSVVFSDYARVGSFSDISDSNYHYMKNLIDNSIFPYSKPILIGTRNYIGSRVALLPGTMTPDNITIGFGSVCNKDYRGIIPENSIMAGVPAKLVKKDIVRIFDFKKESVIREIFN